MNVFEAYENHVRKDMMPVIEKPDDSKLFELEDDTEPSPEDNKDNIELRDDFQLKLSDEDRKSIVDAILQELKPDGGE